MEFLFFGFVWKSRVHDVRWTLLGLNEDAERPCAAPRSSGDREGGTPIGGKHRGDRKTATSWCSTKFSRQTVWYLDTSTSATHHSFQEPHRKFRHHFDFRERDGCNQTFCLENKLGTAQRPAPQGAEVRSVRFWKKNVRSFSVFFFWCKAMQMQSKWRAEVQEVVITWWTWNNPRAAHGHLCAGDWSFFTKKK